MPHNRPYFCTYIVTWKCNARCKMCDIWKRKKTEELNIADIERVFKQIPFIKAVRLTGGEPFIRSDIVDIVNVIAENTSAEIIHLTTNGILTERILECIKKARHRNIHLKVTLNAYGKRHDEVMGYEGAYDKLIATIRALKEIQDKGKFIVAVNQTITDLQSYEDSRKIRRLCEEYNLSYLPAIAYKDAPLYMNRTQREGSPNTDFVCYGDFEKKDLTRILADFLEATAEIRDFAEKTVKRYYLKGLYNRLVLDKNLPSPRCVALRNHLRILPNGDVPVCLYNPETAGNILRDALRGIWKGDKTKKLRRWVAACKGCWAQCEVIPNALFSGDIFKHILR